MVIWQVASWARELEICQREAATPCVCPGLLKNHKEKSAVACELDIYILKKHTVFSLVFQKWTFDPKALSAWARNLANRSFFTSAGCCVALQCARAPVAARWRPICAGWDFFRGPRQGILSVAFLLHQDLLYCVLWSQLLYLFKFTHSEWYMASSLHHGTLTPFPVDFANPFKVGPSISGLSSLMFQDQVVES